MFIIYLLFMFIIFVLLLILVGGLALRGMVRRFFGGGSTPWGSRSQSNNGQQQAHTAYQAPPSKPKLFDKDEGEYVDYEEVR